MSQQVPPLCGWVWIQGLGRHPVGRHWRALRQRDWLLGDDGRARCAWGQSAPGGHAAERRA
ncbi:MAG: hypothetical protein ACI9MC_001071 [Kiritimatiellia bacterium]|jgi:hypothetical protein